MTRQGSARIGVDVLDSTELDQLLRRAWFLRYCYAPEEIGRADELGAERRREFLAGRFAAKEAVLKAMGKGLLQGVAPREICVTQADDGSPEVRLEGAAAELPSPSTDLALSISHKDTVVTAVAVPLPPAHTGTTALPPRTEETTPMTAPNTGEDTTTTAFLRVRIGQEDAHYGGGIVDGAHILKLFGDLVTEITIRTDGDEGLLSEYSAVKFTAPVAPGDYVEATARLTSKTRLRRVVDLRAHKVIAADPADRPSRARRLDEPRLVCSATATTVVPAQKVTAASGED
ncbi:phosphopantetheine--protein transferase-like protein [Saccharopolyspora lacisalsi]|uniref:Holo-[acyl-carrier-protein] synthase n=1 Tax=Halosaccharopolyspora lacisalsi TaxID=1000566 RepID=A0A839DPQ3_9PSEU|nr:phosphopantetheine--protein transferase-like protein [Halosaccharopolyspora lacisalsi]